MAPSRLVRWLPVLPIAAWSALAAAAWLDPTHDPLAHYISWLVDGPMAHLAAVGVLGLLAAVLAAAWHLHRVLEAGALRQAAVAALSAAAVAGALTLVFPSRGFGEPVWHTARHVGLAVGAYAGITGAAGLMAWRARQVGMVGHVAGFAAIVVAMTCLLAVSAISRLTSWDLELRGLAQLLLAATAAGWLAAVLALPPPRTSSS